MSLRLAVPVLPALLLIAPPALAYEELRVITLSGTEIGEVRTPDVMDEDPATIEIDLIADGGSTQTIILESDAPVEHCATTLRGAAGTAAPVTVTVTIDMAAQTMNGVQLESCVASR